MSMQADLDRAKRIAARWHGGQSTALYALASTGRPSHRALDEVRIEMMGSESADAVTALSWLSHWLMSWLDEEEDEDA
jgi:hypothetical protein